MEDHSGCRRAFYWSSRAYYGKQFTNGREKINFGMYAKDGGTTGEMSMRWYDLGQKQPIAKLEAFEDSWSALFSFQDVLQRMEKLDGACITPEQFVALLKDCGFEDITKYENPNTGESTMEQLLSELQAAQRRVLDLRDKLAVAK